jgi:hypothetical protein
MELSIDLEGFDKLAEALRRAPEIVAQELNAFVHASVSLMVTEVQERTPVNKNPNAETHGNLRKSITGQVLLGVTPAGQLGVSTVQGVVGTVTPYAIPVELGTKPHVIVAKNKKALHFGNITVKSVNHPGTKPVGMFKEALDANQGELQKQLAATVDRILERITRA